ncbi:hypothetical protein [Schaalia vaccimaxillae]|uniref:hypothetical protein n=1 Tax=Schaalia vaccimaxillae TaxID=183916 RepID=UPI0003B62A25|nr:hypothetical protein [Schaalia vaccimaxillae]
MSESGPVATTWTKALDVPYNVSASSAEKLRAKYPDATPEQLVQIQNRRFKKRVTVESAAVGGVAAWPGIGTAVSFGASGAQLVAFVSEAAHHCMVVAHLYGIDIKDPAKRTALVLAALTGQEGAQVISLQVGVQAVSWFRDSFLNIRTISAERFNKLMMKWVQRKVLKSAAVSTVGRLIPFGIGAVVGWGVGASMANTAIEGLSVALGPVPNSFPEPTVIDVQVADSQDSSRYENLDLSDEDEGDSGFTAPRSRSQDSRL